jgi:16S rRNA (cytosine1402-N4)-methyltransferase
MQSHKTVLLHEAVDALQIETNHTVVDATYGGGGHTELILSKLREQGTCVAIDVDASALAKKPENPHNATIHLVNDNFRNLTDILCSLHIKSVDGILADLGWRMEQFSSGEKGLSFLHDGPLLMTLGDADTHAFTAYDIVNTWDESVLADIIYGYGEERFARRIAKQIVAKRAIQPIETTFELRDCIETAISAVAKRGKLHPATRTFQALRIAVNEELTVLESFLKDAVAALKPGGRLSIISFHSLEDRIVKHSFKRFADDGIGQIVTRKPIEATEEERETNPRARSAKLRVFTKHNNVEHHEQNTHNT